MNDAPFCLSPTQIARKSLTAAEMSAYSGRDIRLLPLENFPGWENLDKGHRNPLQTRKRRAKAFQEFFIAQGIPFREKDLIAYATTNSSTIFYAQRQKGTPDEQALKEACFSQEHIVRSVLSPAFGRPWSNSPACRHVIMPSVSEPLYHLNKNALLYFREPFDPQNLPSIALALPKHKIKHAPHLPWLPLITDLHELAHSFQIEPLPLSQSDEDSVGWYAEAHATYFSYCALQTASPGEETLRSFRHGLYWDFLLTDKQHQVAPLIDDFHQGKQTHSFEEIQTASDEIFLHIGLSPDAQKTQHLPEIKAGRTLGNAFPHHKEKDTLVIIASGKIHALETLPNKPELFMSRLAWLAEEKMFTSPLAQQIAERIVEAAQFFNPAFCKAPISLPKRRFQGAPKLPRGPKARQP